MSEKTEQMRRMTASMKERIAGLIDNTARIDQPGQQLQLLKNLVDLIEDTLGEIDRIDEALGNTPSGK